MNLWQKLLEVRKHVSYLKKEAQGQQYSYTSSSQVLASVREKLNDVGVLLKPEIIGSHVDSSDKIEWLDKNNLPKTRITYFTEIDMTMTWINVDNPEERDTSSWYAQGVDIAGEKGVGKALTYGEKYFILKYFNIPTDKDDPDSFQQKYESEESKQLKQEEEAKKAKAAEDKLKNDIRNKWVTLGGKEEAMQPWIDEQLKQGASLNTIHAALAKKLVDKQKETK